jgi:hypothetical protein
MIPTMHPNPLCEHCHEREADWFGEDPVHQREAWDNTDIGDDRWLCGPCVDYLCLDEIVAAGGNPTDFCGWMGIDDNPNWWRVTQMSAHDLAAQPGYSLVNVLAPEDIPPGEVVAERWFDADGRLHTEFSRGGVVFCHTQLRGHGHFTGDLLKLADKDVVWVLRHRGMRNYRVVGP